MLNVLEPGTVMDIHRDHQSSEIEVFFRGKISWLFYDEIGNERGCLGARVSEGNCV